MLSQDVSAPPVYEKAGYGKPNQRGDACVTIKKFIESGASIICMQVPLDFVAACVLGFIFFVCF